MRLSANQSDRAYHGGMAIDPSVRVFLDDVVLKNVITADEEKRFVVVYKLDSSGRFVVRDGEIATEEFCGDVRIECPDWMREAAKELVKGVAA